MSSKKESPVGYKKRVTKSKYSLRLRNDECKKTNQVGNSALSPTLECTDNKRKVNCNQGKSAQNENNFSKPENLLAVVEGMNKQSVDVVQDGSTKNICSLRHKNKNVCTYSLRPRKHQILVLASENNSKSRLISDELKYGKNSVNNHNTKSKRGRCDMITLNRLDKFQENVKITSSFTKNPPKNRTKKTSASIPKNFPKCKESLRSYEQLKNRGNRNLPRIQVREKIHNSSDVAKGDTRKKHSFELRDQEYKKSGNYTNELSAKSITTGINKESNVINYRDKNKNVCKYSLQPRKHRILEGLDSENDSKSRIESDELKYRKNSVDKHNTKSKRGCCDMITLNRLDKFQEDVKITSSVTKEHPKNKTKKTHTSALIPKNFPKCKESLRSHQQMKNRGCRYSLRIQARETNHNSSDVAKGDTRKKYSFELRDQEYKKPGNYTNELSAKSITTGIKKESNLINYRENPILNPKRKRLEKLPENIEIKLGARRKSSKYVTKKTNLSALSAKNALQSEEKSGSGNVIENESFNGEVLISYEKCCQSKSVKKNYLKNSKAAYTRKSSFERYGVLFPSYEKVVDNINKIRKEADALDTYEKEYGDSDNSLPLALKYNNNPEFNEGKILLDCGHLCEEKLKEYFQQNLDYITNILNGKLTSQRHERYKNCDPKAHLTMDDLTYSPTIIVFTSYQRDLLFKLLEDKFDPEGEKTEYLFKVLLPELCLKIFMDVHEMSAHDALDYLNWRPLD